MGLKFYRLLLILSVIGAVMIASVGLWYAFLLLIPVVIAMCGISYYKLLDK